jgi:membrane-bound lytic murein transglycosylase B
VYGPRLDGASFVLVPDSDGGALDGDAEVDRAVGPLQFIPQTWERWRADGDGDGATDPQDLDDAALAAAHYLCAAGDLSDPVALHRAVFSYNHDEDYVQLVLGRAADYDRMLGG